MEMQYWGSGGTEASSGYAVPAWNRGAPAVRSNVVARPTAAMTVVVASRYIVALSELVVLLAGLACRIVSVCGLVRLKNIGLVYFWLMSASALADLKPLKDEELSDISGQAFVSINESSENGRDYLRMNIGMEIRTQLNIEEFKIGEYPRWENGDPCFSCTGNEPGLEKQPADIWVKNLSLGAFAKYSGIQMDGRYYNEGEVIPFELFDPYVEIVQENGELIGFRTGVHQARGIFGGDILSFTGDLPVKVRDTASALTRAPNRPWWIGLAGALLPRTPVEGDAVTLTPPEVSNGTVDYGTGGQPDNVRATHIGLPDNSNFAVGPIPFLGTINFKTTDCNLFGIPVCFPLTQFKSLNVGEKQADGSYEPTGGWFLSMQKQAVDWVDPIDQSVTTAPAGAFFSVPVGGVELTLDEAFNGTPRPRVELIDRGLDLF